MNENGNAIVPTYIADFTTQTFKRRAVNYPVFQTLTFEQMFNVRSRASTATYFDKFGIMRTAANNELRFDHDPSTVVSRTNQTVNSRNFNTDGNPSSGRWWVSGGSAVQVYDEHLDMNVQLFTEDTSTGSHLIRAPQAPDIEYPPERRVIQAKIKAGTATTVALTPKGSFLENNDVHARFDLINGIATTVSTTIENAGMESLGDGWWRCWCVMRYGGTGNSFRFVTIQTVNPSNNQTNSFTGTGRTFYMCDPQFEKTSNNLPTEYIPTYDANPVTIYSSYATSLGLLLESQRTNLLTYSEQFELGRNNMFNTGTVTQNVSTAPDGTKTVDLLTSTTAGSLWYYGRVVSATAGTTYTYSVYAMLGPNASANDARLRLQANGGTFPVYTDVAITSLYGSNFVRYSATFTKPDDTFSMRVGLIVTEGKSVYVWGEQLETAFSASSYIKTTTATSTRAPDYLRSTTNNDWIQQGKGNVYTRWSRTDTTTGPSFSRAFQLANSSTGHQISLYRNGPSSNRMGMYITASAGVQADTGTYGSAVLSLNNISTAVWNTNYTRAYNNGNAGGTDTSVDIPTVDMLSIYYSNGNDQFEKNFGHIKSFVYWPDQLSVAENTRLGTTTL